MVSHLYEALYISKSKRCFICQIFLDDDVHLGMVSLQYRYVNGLTQDLLCTLTEKDNDPSKWDRQGHKIYLV